ncbi:MAG: EamA family transporter [Actinobacteria bacterium]|nr:EamA family transporter [Actinomycetota bacterium]
MSVVLAMLAALSFGSADFLGGIAGRRLGVVLVIGIGFAIGVLCAGVAVLLFPGDGPTGNVLFWGAIAGLGDLFGAGFLYYGLMVGTMSLVATLSGLLTAVIPVCFGLLRGNSLSTAAALGVLIAIPSIALVSWQSEPGGGAAGKGHGAIWGLLGGIGFGVFFIAINEAGTASGAWPIAAADAAAFLVVAPVTLWSLLADGLPRSRSAVGTAAVSGLLGGLAILGVLAATNGGELAIVAVLTSLYPGVTAILARLLLDERWARHQKVGLGAAVVAVVLVSLGAS